MTQREEKILATIKKFTNKLPKFPDGRIDYSNSDIALVITVFVKYKDKILKFHEDEVGELGTKLYNEILGIQYGRIEDRYGWLNYID